MKDVVIVSGTRTPVGKYMGSLKTVEAYDLAALVLNEAIRKAKVNPDQVDEVIMGQAYQNGEYVNTARMGLLKAGWPDTIPGVTMDRRCCTGLDVVRMGASLIQSGQAEIVVCGGVESMSNTEFYLPGNTKWGVGGQKGMPRGHGDLKIWGLPFYDRIQRARVMSQPDDRYGVIPSMMSWAEEAAKIENVTREACDQWALESHKKACAAMEKNLFADEIVPVPVPQKKGRSDIIFDRDENPRADTTFEKLQSLKPVLGGVCTAGNSSTENDGAAAVVLSTPEKAKELGVTPFVRFKSCVVAGADPRQTYLTVPVAVEKALAKAEMKIDQMELIEIQEAFAAQVLADLVHMNVKPEEYGKVNVNGSGISLGHPIACTGSRVLVTLIHEMRRSGKQYALETICGGGGLGIAAVLEAF